MSKQAALEFKQIQSTRGTIWYGRLTLVIYACNDKSRVSVAHSHASSQTNTSVFSALPFQTNNRSSKNKREKIKCRGGLFNDGDFVQHNWSVGISKGKDSAAHLQRSCRVGRWWEGGIDYFGKVVGGIGSHTCNLFFNQNITLNACLLVFLLICSMRMC